MDWTNDDMGKLKGFLFFPAVVLWLLRGGEISVSPLTASSFFLRGAGTGLSLTGFSAGAEGDPVNG